MFKNIKTIAAWEYLHRIRSKAFILSIILPFIILALAIGPQYLATKSGPDQERLILLCSQNTFTQIVKNVFEKNYLMNDNQPRYLWMDHPGISLSDEEDVIKDILKHQIADAVIHLKIFTQDSIAASIYYETLGPEHVSRIKNGIQEAAETFRIQELRLDPKILSSIRKPISTEEFQITDKGIFTDQDILIRYMTPFIFMFVLIMGIITTSQSIISSIIEERTHKIIEILLSTVKPSEIMTGKILGMGFLGLTQIFVYMVILYGAGMKFLPDRFQTGLISTSNLFWYLIFFILGYLMFSAIYVAIGSLFDNERDAQQLGGILSLIALLPIYFIAFMLEHPESHLTVVLSYIPLITPLLMIARVGIMSLPFWTILSMALYLVFWIVIIIWFSSRIFRLAILMYGKRPTFQEIIRWNKNLSR